MLRSWCDVNMIHYKLLVITTEGAQAGLWTPVAFIETTAKLPELLEPRLGFVLQNHTVVHLFIMHDMS